MKRSFLSISFIIIVIQLFPQSVGNNVSQNIDSLYIEKMLSRREVDEFTDDIVIDCPVLGHPLCTVHIGKTIHKGVPIYLLRFMMRDIVSIQNGNGVIILFSDGSRLSKPEAEVICEYSDIGDIFHDGRERFTYQITSAIKLTPSDLKILGSKTIKKFRLYISDAELRPKDAEDLMIYTRNIVSLK